MRPKKICRIKKSSKFYLRHIKLVKSSRVKPFSSNTYIFLKSYIDIFNKKIDYQALVYSLNFKKVIAN